MLRDFRPGMTQTGWKSENMFADDAAQIGTKRLTHVHERPTDRVFLRETIAQHEWQHTIIISHELSVTIRLLK